MTTVTSELFEKVEVCVVTKDNTKILLGNALKAEKVKEEIVIPSANRGTITSTNYYILLKDFNGTEALQTYWNKKCYIEINSMIPVRRLVYPVGRIALHNNCYAVYDR